MTAYLWVRMTWASGQVTIMPLIDYVTLPSAAMLGSRAEFVWMDEARREQRREHIAARCEGRHRGGA